MAFTEQIILVSVGAGIALLSSLISIFVQHRLQLRRTKRSEKIEGEIAAQYARLREEYQKRLNHSGEPVVDVLKISKAVSKELAHKNLDEVPTEKLVELYLACHQHMMYWSEWQSRQFMDEADIAKKLSGL